MELDPCLSTILRAVGRVFAHLDAHMGVVGVSSRPQVLASSLGPQEVAEELGAVLQIVATHPPLPGLPALQAWGIIAGTTFHAPSTAGSGQRMREGSRRHCVEEGRLLEACAGEKEAQRPAAASPPKVEVAWYVQQIGYRSVSLGVQLCQSSSITCPSDPSRKLPLTWPPDLPWSMSPALRGQQDRDANLSNLCKKVPWTWGGTRLRLNSHLDFKCFCDNKKQVEKPVSVSLSSVSQMPPSVDDQRQNGLGGPA